MAYERSRGRTGVSNTVFYGTDGETGNTGVHTFDGKYLNEGSYFGQFEIDAPRYSLYTMGFMVDAQYQKDNERYNEPDGLDSRADSRDFYILYVHNYYDIPGTGIGTTFANIGIGFSEANSATNTDSAFVEAAGERITVLDKRDLGGEKGQAVVRVSGSEYNPNNPSNTGGPGHYNKENTDYRLWSDQVDPDHTYRWVGFQNGDGGDSLYDVEIGFDPNVSGTQHDLTNPYVYANQSRYRLYLHEAPNGRTRVMHRALNYGESDKDPRKPYGVNTYGGMYNPYEASNPNETNNSIYVVDVGFYDNSVSYWYLYIGFYDYYYDYELVEGYQAQVEQTLEDNDPGIGVDSPEQIQAYAQSQLDYALGPWVGSSPPEMPEYTGGANTVAALAYVSALEFWTLDVSTYLINVVNGGLPELSEIIPMIDGYLQSDPQELRAQLLDGLPVSGLDSYLDGVDDFIASQLEVADGYQSLIDGQVAYLSDYAMRNIEYANNYSGAKVEQYDPDNLLMPVDDIMSEFSGANEGTPLKMLADAYFDMV